MKGLVYKDFMCLRKNLKTFVFVTLGVIVMSLMIILSTRYGNLAETKEFLQVESEADEAAAEAMIRGVIWCILFIPMAFIGNVAECFKEDRKAGFARPLFSMPLSAGQIVGSRYLFCILFAAVSLGASVLVALCISGVPGGFYFSELYGMCFSFCGFFLIYMSLILFLLYFVGADRADLIQTAPILLLLLVVMAAFWTKAGTLSEEEFSRLISSFLEKAESFLKRGYVVLFPAALVSLGVSFAGSAAVVKHRKGGL